MSQNSFSAASPIGSPIASPHISASSISGSFASGDSPIAAPADVPADVPGHSTEPLDTQDDSMEGIEQTFVESTVLHEPTGEVTPIKNLATGESKPTTNNDKIEKIMRTISCIQEEIASLTMYVGAAPENDPLLNNKRTRLNRRNQDLKLMKNSLEIMKDTMKDTLQASKKSSVVPVKLPMFCWEGHDN
ncbi:hypothetical protein INT47_005999, partial [Mucor saturninus]